MKIITIRRVYYYPEDGTFGIIDDDGTIFGLTVELSWKQNQKKISCIPDGEYVCKRIQSPTFGNTFEVTNVPNRTEILFHIANTVLDLEGCIGIGENFNSYKSKVAVLGSGNRPGEGFLEFKSRLSGHNEFKLVIEKMVKA